MEKVCFLFGNRNTPEHITDEIYNGALRCYSKCGARIFVVGHYGNFDRMAGTAVKKLKNVLPDITLLMLTPYHPSERSVVLMPGWDGSLYPEGMESVPRKYAILRANEYMAKTCDCAVCYVRNPGNSRKLLANIKRRGIPFCDLAE